MSNLALYPEELVPEIFYFWWPAKLLHNSDYLRTKWQKLKEQTSSLFKILWRGGVVLKFGTISAKNDILTVQDKHI